jgi:hypothetical protein
MRVFIAYRFDDSKSLNQRKACLCMFPSYSWLTFLYADCRKKQSAFTNRINAVNHDGFEMGSLLDGLSLRSYRIIGMRVSLFL